MGGEDPLALHPQVHEQQRVLLLVRQTGGGGPAAVQELEVAVELGHPSPEVDGGVSGMLEVGCRGGNWDGPVVCHGCSPALSSSGGEWKVSPAWAKAGQSKLEGRWGVGQAAVPAAPSFWLGLGAGLFLLLHRRRQLRCW